MALGVLAASLGLGALDSFQASRREKQEQSAASRRDAMKNLIGSLGDRAQQSQQAQQQRPGMLQILARDPELKRMLAEQIDGGGLGSLLKKFLPRGGSQAAGSMLSPGGSAHITGM